MISIGLMKRAGFSDALILKVIELEQKDIQAERDRCFLYVIGREDGPVKVGITNRVGMRLSVLQTGCPFPIKLLHSVEMRDRDHALRHERQFQEVQADRRLIGEWFNLAPAAAIESINVALDVEAYFEEQK